MGLLVDLISRRDDELVDMGYADPAALRERWTGHRRRMGPLWARSIGLWGGTHTLAEIGGVVGKASLEVKSYAKARGLKWKTKNLRRTPADLAVLCFALRGPAVEVGAALGVLPVEVVLGRLAITDLLAAESATFVELLAWDADELEAAGNRHGLSLRLVEPRPVEHHDAVAAAEHEGARRRAMIRRLCAEDERAKRRALILKACAEAEAAEGS